MFKTERHNHHRTDGLSASLQLGKAAEHLVCAELLLQGWSAFLVDAGLPYDVVVDVGAGKFWRIQVKATCRMMQRNQTRKSYVPTYRFVLKHTRSQDTRCHLRNCDFLALVALDKRLIAFLPVADYVHTDGSAKRTIELKTRSFDYKRAGVSGKDPAKCGKFIEDYAEFKPGGSNGVV